MGKILNPIHSTDSFIRCFLTVLYCISSWIGVGQIVLLTSSDLPIFIINTNGKVILTEPKITADLEVIYNGPGKRNNVSDNATHFKGKIGVELRGSSSLDLSPKKPLGFETRNADGTNLNVSLLGLPEENDWVLIAPYSDKSLMRDVLIHNLARQIMPYSSRTRFCEVIINQEYQGVYVLMEKIKRDKNRVDLKSISTTVTKGDSLTGGYVLKIDKTTGSTPQGGYTSIYSNRPGPTPNYTYYQYEHPEANVLNSDQKKYIATLVQNFEASFLSTDFTHLTNGYRKYADEKSMIDFLLLNEIANNVDGYRLSTYMHKDIDSNSPKIKFGPVWDFNLGFGNANYCQGGEPTGLAFEFNNRCINDYWLVPFYWPKVMSDPSFFNSTKARWAQLRKNTFLESNMMNTIDSLSRTIQEAQSRNFNRWKILDLYVWPNLFVGGTYEAEINYLKNWGRNRIKFLDGYFGYNPTVAIQTTKEIKIKLYPNPVIDHLQIDLPAAYSKARIRIFNQMGVQLMEQEVHDLQPIPVHPLAQGLYYIQLFDRQNSIFICSFHKL